MFLKCRRKERELETARRRFERGKEKDGDRVGRRNGSERDRLETGVGGLVKAVVVSRRCF